MPASSANKYEHLFGLSSSLDRRKESSTYRQANGAKRPCLRCGLLFRPTRRRWYTCGPCFVVNSHQGESATGRTARHRASVAAP